MGVPSAEFMISLLEAQGVKIERDTQNELDEPRNNVEAQIVISPSFISKYKEFKHEP